MSQPKFKYMDPNDPVYRESFVKQLIMCVQNKYQDCFSTRFKSFCKENDPLICSLQGKDVQDIQEEITELLDKWENFLKN